MEEYLVFKTGDHSRLAYIYSLSDPDTLEVRYVGKTIDVKKRLYGHVEPSSTRKNNHKNNWVKSLAKSGKKPLITVLFAVNHKEWENKERETIVSFKTRGARLTNGTQGGDGGAIDKLKGVPRTAETKARISKANKGKTLPPEVRERIAAKLRGRKCPDEERAKMRVRQLESWANDDGSRRAKAIQTAVKTHSRQVFQYNSEFELVNTFRSARQAARETGAQWKMISQCCKGERKSTRGCFWSHSKIDEPRKIFRSLAEKTPISDDSKKAIAEKVSLSWKNGSRDAGPESGVIGVTWNKRSGKWRARKMVNWEMRNFGLFDTIKEASAALSAIKKKD